MPKICFTTHLERYVDIPVTEVGGTTVREVLDEVFATNHRVRSYVLDDQGALRHHVVIFVDGKAVGDRERLSDSVSKGSEVYVMQALSGG